MEDSSLTPGEISSIKTKAQEDAKKMEAHVLEECEKAGRDPPSYAVARVVLGVYMRVFRILKLRF
jgi:hypothetical protein